MRHLICLDATWINQLAGCPTSRLFCEKWDSGVKAALDLEPPKNANGPGISEAVRENR